jgi:CRISPR-associated endonuclease/helicase Cas3
MAALREVLGDRAGDVICGDESLENYRRYSLQARESTEACQFDVAPYLEDGRKVLWVCNTVKDAIKAAREARRWSGIDPARIIVYHSRFRYRDRVKRQQEVLAEFAYFRAGERKGQRIREGPSLLIATQVCEMSLDISADVLVTAECPLPSLVQRLGRLNRYATSDDPWPCFVYPFQGEPYGDALTEMDATRNAVRDLSGMPCSQRDLASRLDSMTVSEEFERHSAWLDDGWVTEPVQLRDGDNSITVIREEDLAEIENELGPEHTRPTKWTSARLVPWTIPMLYQRNIVPISRKGGYPVAAAGVIHYDQQDGATWASENQR